MLRPPPRIEMVNGVNDELDPLTPKPVEKALSVGKKAPPPLLPRLTGLCHHDTGKECCPTIPTLKRNMPSLSLFLIFRRDSKHCSSGFCPDDNVCLPEELRQPSRVFLSPH
uniref:Uncharacterized protein n=1 Tax=Panagrellus redivivus TaxID=6233 RepID=A0A7E4V935_PANRE